MAGVLLFLTSGRVSDLAGDFRIDEEQSDWPPMSARRLSLLKIEKEKCAGSARRAHGPS